MSTAPSLGPGAAAKRFVYRVFGTLPMRVRRFIIRTIRPSYTAGAVAIIERDDGRWLFVRPVYRRGWALPGGLVDRGESPARTVVREMREELGIDVTIASDGWVIIDTDYDRLEITFRVDLEPGVDPDEIRIATAELRDIGWFDPDDPPLLEDETFHSLLLTRQVEQGGPGVLIVPDPDVPDPDVPDPGAPEPGPHGDSDTV